MERQILFGETGRVVGLATPGVISKFEAGKEQFIAEETARLKEREIQKRASEFAKPLQPLAAGALRTAQEVQEKGFTTSIKEGGLKSVGSQLATIPVFTAQSFVDLGKDIKRLATTKTTPEDVASKIKKEDVFKPSGEPFLVQAIPSATHSLFDVATEVRKSPIIVGGTIAAQFAVFAGAEKLATAGAARIGTALRIKPPAPEIEIATVGARSERAVAEGEIVATLRFPGGIFREEVVAVLPGQAVTEVKAVGNVFKPSGAASFSLPGELGGTFGARTVSAVITGGTITEGAGVITTTSRITGAAPVRQITFIRSAGAVDVFPSLLEGGTTRTIAATFKASDISRSLRLTTIAGDILGTTKAEPLALTTTTTTIGRPRPAFTRVTPSEFGIIIELPPKFQQAGAAKTAQSFTVSDSTISLTEFGLPFEQQFVVGKTTPLFSGEFGLGATTKVTKFPSKPVSTPFTTAPGVPAPLRLTQEQLQIQTQQALSQAALTGVRVEQPLRIQPTPIAALDFKTDTRPITTTTPTITGATIISDTRTLEKTRVAPLTTPRVRTREAEVVGIRTGAATAVTPIQAQELKTATVTTTILRTRDPGFPGLTTTGVPPRVPAIPFIPRLPSPPLRFRDVGKTKRTRSISKFTPTATAAAFDIRGRGTRLGTVSGLGIRPIPKAIVKKKKRKRLRLARKRVF